MQIRSFISTSFFRIVAVSMTLAILPLLCVLVIVGFTRVQQSSEYFSERTAYAMRTMADKQSEMDLTARTLLDGVSRARELCGRDFSDPAATDAAHRLFKRLCSNLSLFSDIALYDASGRLVASSVMTPAPGAAPPSLLKFGRELPLDGKRFSIAISDGFLLYLYRVDAGTACPEDGGAAFLAAFMPMENLSANLSQLRLSSGSVVHFLDAGQKTVLRHVVDPEHSEAPDNVEVMIRLHVSESLHQRSAEKWGVITPGAVTADSVRPVAESGSAGPDGAPDNTPVRAEPDAVPEMQKIDPLDAEPQQEPIRIHELKGGDGKLYLLSYVSVRSDAESPPYMYLVMSIDEALAHSVLGGELRHSLVRVAAGILITVLLLWILCALIFKLPARKLLAAAESIGRGDYQARLSLPRGGAFEDFSAALYGMAEKLEKYERHIREAAENAKRAMRSKSEFLTNMSHEIRTPLNAILGMTYLVQKSALTPSQRAYINKIQSAGKSLLHVVNDILDFSKLESDKNGMENIRFAVRDLFSSLASHYSSKAAANGLSFDVSIAPDVPMYLAGDPLRLEQAISQLLNYSFRNTRQGGIQLSCTLAGMARSECTLRIAVSDTGKGLTPNELEYLRMVLASKSRPAGSLKGRDAPELEAGRNQIDPGLNMARRLFECMRGQIEVSSELGRGSVFICTALFSYMEIDLTRHSIVLAGKRVLIADSDEISRALHTSMLNNFFINARGVSLAGQLLQDLQLADQAGEPYDFVVLDWRNLELETAEIIRVIRKDLGLSRQPRILVVSSIGRAEIRKLAADAGADVFLHKPLDASVLLDTMMGLYSVSELSVLGREVAESFRNLPKQTLNGVRVLLVEDNEVNRQLATEIMTGQGIEVTCAATGRQALEELSRFVPPSLSSSAVRAGALAPLPGDAAVPLPPYDIVLMDLQMPEMDGFEATWRIRHDTHLGAAHLPVIAMTAQSNPEEISACRKVGMDDHVAKPIEANLFFDTLERWLPVLPDANRLIYDQFRALRELIMLKEQSSLSNFAAIQDILQVFTGDGRLKKLQKYLWDFAWDEAASFIKDLERLLYPPQADGNIIGGAPSETAAPDENPSGGGER